MEHEGFLKARRPARSRLASGIDAVARAENCTARFALLSRPGQPCAILRVRSPVQHCQGESTCVSSSATLRTEFRLQVARGGIVPFFNDMFDALCKLSADSDPNVQNAAHLLDRLVKDIVTESTSFRHVEPLLRHSNHSV